VNGPTLATLSDLAGLGLLVGWRVRLLEDVGRWMKAGSVGLVIDVRSSEPRATVRYVLHGAEPPWKYQEIESPFAKLELVGEDEAA
jgi:hypothetical protein